MPVVEGDPFGDLKQEKTSTSPDPRTVGQFHERADTDSSTGAIHHSLGISHNQASPGDHAHDGANSALIGRGRKLTVTTIAVTDAQRIQNILAFLHKFVDFTEV